MGGKELLDSLQGGAHYDMNDLEANGLFVL